MLRHTLISVLAIHSLLVVGCATRQPYNPFKVEPAQFREKVRTIALVPVGVPKGMDNPDEIAKRYEAIITSKLEEAGFKLVSSKEYSAIYDPMVKQVGGLYDPITGEPIEEKFKSAREHAVRELINKHRVDALLYPRIVVEKANWFRNRAMWSGVKEPTTGKEGFWADLNTPSAYGTIPALSLVIQITDSNQTVYYVNSGGIQLLQLYTREGFLQPYRFTEVGASELLKDKAKDERAVSLALAGLIKGSPVAVSEGGEEEIGGQAAKPPGSP